MKNAVLPTCLWALCLLAMAQVCHAQMYATFNGAQLVYGGGQTSNILGHVQNINPAYLGTSSQSGATLNLMQVGFNAHSNNFERKDVMNFLFSRDSISQMSKDKLLQNLVTEGGDLRLNGTMHINWISGAWIKEGFGGLALNLSDYVTGLMHLDQQVATTVFADTLLNQDLPANNSNMPLGPDGKPLKSSVLYNHARELNISYGRTVFNNDKVKLVLGATYRQLWGIGHYDSSVASDSTGSGNSSFSDFYYAVGQLTIDSLFTKKSGRLFDASGRGQSFSAGIHFMYKNKLSVDFAAINMGKLKWSDNVMQANNVQVNPSDSLQTIDTYKIVQEVKDFANILPFSQGQGFSTPTNAELRFNVTYRFTKGFSLYTDMLFPTRNQRQDYGYTPGYLLGFDLGIVPQQIHLSAGAYYNPSFGWRVPAGLAISLGSNKAFLSITTGDIMTIITKKVEPLTAISVSLIGVNFN
ncbi:MAG TPA: hypothetical protein PK239_14645 [Chitinophagales bacterium]|nr:hypothetical protein [Chitinophagales bacterium]HRK28512.1 hypothetical protein [Chitinophagales bacterium]